MRTQQDRKATVDVHHLAFSARVVRGAGAINQLGALCAVLGRRAMVIGGRRALASIEQAVFSQLVTAGVTLAAMQWYGGECSETHINRLGLEAKAEGIDVIIGAGGGKAIDTAKAVGASLGVPVVTLPTIAATCAAVTPLTIRYFDDGHFRDLFPLPQAPAAVVIDTQLMALSPLRWLAAGLGDTLAKWYEYRSIAHPAGLNGLSASASANSRICYDLILHYGEAACGALTEGKPTPALEQVADAIFIFAGLTSIMGSGAHASAAHAIYEGFTVNDKTRHFGHGLLVGYGNLCLLALERRGDEELLAAVRLAKACAVPTSLAEICDDLTSTELDAICRSSVEAPDMANMPHTVSADDVLSAMIRVDALAAMARR